MDLKEKYIHRDLSWLSFNERVLEESVDARNPLMERIKFLAIFANNLDEFFMVRVAGLKRLLDADYNRKDSFGYFPQDLFSEIKNRVDQLIKKLYDIYQGKVLKDLEKNKIFLRKMEDLAPAQKKHIKKYFESTVFPIITPMAVDQGHPFPALPSRTVFFAVTLKRYEKLNLAILPIPKNIPRLLRLPSEEDEYSFILIDDIIRENLKNFFKGYRIEGNALFRVIRDSELTVNEEYTPDLLRAIEDEVKKRPKAKVVYLETEKAWASEFLEILCQGIDFPQEEVTLINGDLDLSFLFELFQEVRRPDLCYKDYIPGKIPYENIFQRISEGNFLVHVPFQSFYATVDLIRTAARDENVLAIKMTLYRTNEDSEIIKSLKEAAKNKKQVTVLVEIKARFDEEKNISWVKELEESGCHVIYGIAGIKIHSKMTLIVRKEEGRITRYVHLSTGNYNEKTARIYSDLGFFTANEDFARDISDVFNVITGYSMPSPWKRIISSPYDLRQYFFQLIDKEIDFQKRSKNGFIFAKMNSLEDTLLIDKLYEASNAGVKIQLIVRGICSLIPGIPGVSENIEVKSIVGRFLEHTRIFLFKNNGSPRLFISSADWMTRNFDKRIEVLFEIYKEDLKEHLEKILGIYWKDTLKARLLLPDRNYVRPESRDEKFNAQDHLIELYSS
ncbi:MAG: polyphosphate kinase 1 [Candidatus Aureabacteria bacterium]|nr:polyphosphate kinase 1 [Candidatus Auribacterota bacterium]